MNRSLAVVSIVLVAAIPLAFAGDKSGHADVDKTIIELEKQLWKAWEAQDPAPATKLMRDDAKIVGPWGTWEKSAWITQLEGKYCEVRGWSLSDLTVTKVSKGAMLLSYTAEQDATCDGEQVDSPIIVSSIWARRGDSWQSVLYNEAPLEAE